MPIDQPAPRVLTRPPASSLRRRFVVPALILASVLIVDALVGEKGYRQVNAVERERAALDAQIEQLRLENAALRRRIVRLRHDPRAIEELARRDLGLIKPGEKLFIIRDRDEALENAPEPPPRSPR